MNIAFYTTQKDWGGGEVLAADLAAALRRQGHSVGWIVRQGGEPQRRITNTYRQSIWGSIHGRGRGPSAFRAIARVLRQRVPDVFIMNDTHAVAAGGVASFLCGQHRPLRVAVKHTIFPLRSRFKYRLLCDRVFCVSAAAQKTVVQGGFPESCTFVVPGGIRPVEFQEEVRRYMRASLSLGDGDFMVLAVGNLLPCKGHRELIRAMGVLRSHASMRLYLAGEGAERQRLLAEARRCGIESKVTMLGFHDDVPALMQAADLIVHPSHAEGLSLVLIQAQMLRRPIVATQVGGAAEVLAAGSAPGLWTVPPRSVHELADAMATAYQAIRSSSEAELLHANLDRAQRYALENYDIHGSARRLADILAHLLTVPPH
ncbi:MAG: glycosyl transferase [Pirellulaceae bacterium]|nr:MAG: glycosyl transferase [Pirellulaceae bacterium]